MKRPAFQFYPGDWLRDTALRACSIEARGLWIDLLALMHQAEPYGHLVLNGAAITDATLARMVGEPVSKVRRALTELEANGVSSRTDSGHLYSRRMVKDERLREVRANAGKLGGNPALLNQNHNQADNQPDNQGHKQAPTPSSSSSSSSSKETDGPRKRGSRLPKPFEIPPEWVSEGNRIEAEMGTPLGVNMKTEFAKFCDHWWAKSGRDAAKEDWLATWRNWIRRACEFAPKNNSQPAAGPKISIPTCCHCLNKSIGMKGGASYCAEHMPQARAA